MINITTGIQRELVIDAGRYGRRHASLGWRWQGDSGALSIYAGRAESNGEPLTIFEPFPEQTTLVYLDA